MEADDRKQRHGCLTAYLIFIIVTNSAIALAYTLGKTAIQEKLPDLPEWAFWVLPAAGIFNLACAAALFRWKKWGFYGFVLSGLVAFGVNITLGQSPTQSFIGLLGVSILYGVLHIGSKNKGWPQLE